MPNTRRIRIDLISPAEKAIYDAIQIIENMSADIQLTDAQILLAQAKEKVANYVDEQLITINKNEQL